MNPQLRPDVCTNSQIRLSVAANSFCTAQFKTKDNCSLLSRPPRHTLQGLSSHSRWSPEKAIQTVSAKC